MLLNPRRCRGYVIGTRFTSHSGATAEKAIPLTITGCIAELKIASASAAPLGGRRVRLRWTLPLAASHTEIVVYRRAGMWVTQRTLRGPGASGAHRLTLRVARSGRYRLGLRARGAGGAISRARLVGVRVR